jgi:ribonuclease Z
MIAPELVNGVFGDPALYLDFRQERRALLFDLGELDALAPAKILRLSDVFVSHAHMDHFSGFDRLLRVCLGRDAPLRLYGPPGFAERVGHKLAAYSWNAADRYAADFTLLAHEIAPDWEMSVARFRCHARFERETLPGRYAAEGVLLDEPEFRVRTAFLDHGIACLGFAFEAKPRVRILAERLAAAGLAAGPWLRELKRAIAAGGGEDALKAGIAQRVDGAKLCYVTDVVHHAENEARIARLAAGADVLFIESVFLAEDAAHAARKFHLTAEQAGRIARAAGARSLMPFHFSPRYAGREAELRAELERAWRG